MWMDLCFFIILVFQIPNAEQSGSYHHHPSRNVHSQTSFLSLLYNSLADLKKLESLHQRHNRERDRDRHLSLELRQKYHDNIPYDSRFENDRYYTPNNSFYKKLAPSISYKKLLTLQQLLGKYRVENKNGHSDIDEDFLPNYSQKRYIQNKPPSYQLHRVERPTLRIRNEYRQDDRKRRPNDRNPRYNERGQHGRNYRQYDRDRRQDERDWREYSNHRQDERDWREYRNYRQDERDWRNNIDYRHDERDWKNDRDRRHDEKDRKNNRDRRQHKIDQRIYDKDQSLADTDDYDQKDYDMYKNPEKRDHRIERFHRLGNRENEDVNRNRQPFEDLTVLRDGGTHIGYTDRRQDDTDRRQVKRILRDGIQNHQDFHRQDDKNHQFRNHWSERDYRHDDRDRLDEGHYRQDDRDRQNERDHRQHDRHYQDDRDYRHDQRDRREERDHRQHYRDIQDIKDRGDDSGRLHDYKYQKVRNDRYQSLENWYQDRNYLDIYTNRYGNNRYATEYNTKYHNSNNRESNLINQLQYQKRNYYKNYDQNRRPEHKNRYNNVRDLQQKYESYIKTLSKGLNINLQKLKKYPEYNILRMNEIKCPEQLQCISDCVKNYSTKPTESPNQTTPETTQADCYKACIDRIPCEEEYDYDICETSDSNQSSCKNSPDEVGSTKAEELKLEENACC